MVFLFFSVIGGWGLGGPPPLRYPLSPSPSSYKQDILVFHFRQFVFVYLFVLCVHFFNYSLFIYFSISFLLLLFFFFLGGGGGESYVSIRNHLRLQNATVPKTPNGDIYGPSLFVIEK